MKKIWYLSVILFFILIIVYFAWNSEYIQDTFLPYPLGRDTVRKRSMSFSDSEMVNTPFMRAIVNCVDYENKIHYFNLFLHHMPTFTILSLENLNITNFDKCIKSILKENNIIIGIENYSCASSYMYFSKKFNIDDTWYRVIIKTKSKKDSSIHYEDFLMPDVNLLCNVLKKNNVLYISEFETTLMKNNDNRLLYLYFPKIKIKVTIGRLEKYSFDSILDSRIILRRY